MAKVTNIGIGIRCMIGGVTFRILNGKTYLSRKPEIAPKRIKNSAEFANTRKLNNEFKGTVAATRGFVATIRTGINMTQGKGEELRRKVHKAMHRIKEMDKEGRYGERGIYVSRYGRMLDDMTIGTHNPTLSTITDPTIERTEDGTVRLTIEAEMASEMRYANGSTHTKVYLTLLGVSDYVYDERTREYRAANTEAEGYSATAESDYIPHSGRIEKDIVLTLKPEICSTENVAIMAAYGVRHFKKCGERYVAMKNACGFKIRF